MKVNIKRLSCIAAIFSMAMVLGACAESVDNVDVEKPVSAETNVTDNYVDLSEYPKGIQDQTVSVEYYNVVMGFINEIAAHGQRLDSIKGTNTITTLTENQKEQTIEEAKNYLVYLNGIKRDVNNDAEREIDNYFGKAIYHRENITNYYIKYLSGEESYLSTMKSERDTFYVEYDILLRIMEKYELLDVE